MERALELTCEFVRTREVFGGPLGALRNTRFAMAEVKAATDVCRVYTDHVAHLAWFSRYSQGARRPREVRDVVSQGARRPREVRGKHARRDTRVQRSLAGSSEVMRHIVGRSMRLDR
jgi:alkylation response protein AidB-like acyl-CoA dehydrogenase